MTTDPSQTRVDNTDPPALAEDAAPPISADTAETSPASQAETEGPDGEQSKSSAQDVAVLAETSEAVPDAHMAATTDADRPLDALADGKPSAESSTDSGTKSASQGGKIRIGSRRTGTGEKVTSAKPLLAGEAHQPVAQFAPETEDEDVASGRKKPQKRVPVPSLRDPLPPELEQEINSALGDQTLDDLVSSEPSEEVGEALEMESRHRGTIVKIHGDNVFFSLGGRNQGVASLRQFKEPPLVGTQSEIVVSGINREDGLYELIVPGASVQVHDWEDVVEGSVVEARITGSNTGGLECLVGSLRGFVPASQIEMFHVDDFSDYHEKKLPCVVTEANRQRRNLVLSHRAVLEREKEEQRQQRLEELEIGQVVEGVVSSIRNFGAFVDIGGLDGLVHVSRLSWERVEDPNEVLQVGQKVRVKVEKVDPQTGKIGLTYRDLLEHPWTDVEQRFPEDSIVKGTVTRTANFGAFVKVAPGVEGLVHISELAHHRVVQVTSVVKEGDEIDVKILSVDPEAQRMSLSLKETHALPEPKGKTEGEEQADEPPPEPIVPKRNTPLKGGTGRSSGGEEFGLKW